MTSEICTISRVRRASVLDDAALAHLSAVDPSELKRTQAAVANALQCEMELGAFAALWGLVASDTVTIHKSRSVGKSEARAWRSLCGTPETTKPIPRPSDPVGNRAQRRRTQALSRSRRRHRR